MVPSLVLKTGDLLQIACMGPVVSTILAPHPMVGTGVISTDTTILCVQGDEIPPSALVPHPYISGSFVIPGMIKLNLTLPPTSKSMIYKVIGRPVLLMGVPFPVTLQVVTPAQMPAPPAPPVPDPLPSYPAIAQYISTTAWEISA